MELNEIRKDYLLDRWVIISPKRSQRPHNTNESKKLPIKDENCIFCPGNEHLTPDSIIEKPIKNWNIRVVRNKFPALTKETDFFEKTEKFIRKFSGYGSHYILIDTHIHNLHPANYTLLDWERWFETITDLFYLEMADESIKYVLVFKNHGLEAGASQPHPHTQIISTPIIPFLITEELKRSEEYYRITGHCPYCDIIEIESKKKERVVFENDYVIVFCPYAPLQPYEVWIFPKYHIPSIQMNQKTKEELLKALGHIIDAYYRGLNDPAFNFIIHTAYPRMEEPTTKSYHLHIEIFPRLERDAGFEFGAGINITTVSPENSAKFLRQIFRK